MENRNLSFYFITWWGSGLIKRAPGTWGTLAALPFGVAMLYFAEPAVLLAASLLAFALALPAINHHETQTGLHDDKRIVIDEVVGMWLTLLAAGLNPLLILLAFVFFRVFDILKPWPVCVFDTKVKGAWGVMLDDVAAAFMAALCLLGLRYVGLG